MPEAFAEFFSKQPFWATVVYILMLLPVLGIIAWVILRAFRGVETGDTADKGDSVSGSHKKNGIP